MSQNPYEKLKETSIYTTPREELTTMLYDGALKFCNQTVTALENKELIRANELLLKVQNIIRELQFTLNYDIELSKDFSIMYEYIHRRLVEANIKKDMAILCESRDLIREFRDMWKEAILIAKSQGYSSIN